MRPLSVLLSILILLTQTLPALASEDYLSLSAGYFNVLDNDKAVDIRIEYRWNEPLLWLIKPFAGVEFTSDGAAYGLGGILLDLAIAPHWYITPSLGVGIYHDGDGINLGHTLQYRSQLELAYEFESRDRLSAGFSHISNGSIVNNNPGTEIFSLYYHMPTNRIWGSNPM